MTTWTGGSCGIALESVRGKLPRDTTVMELGYQSSECRGTIALEPETRRRPADAPPSFPGVCRAERLGQRPAGVPHAWPARRWPPLLRAVHDDGRPYRYFMNDLLDVTGFFHQTPLPALCRRAGE